MDFGTGLLAYLRRNPRWRADKRQLVRVAFALELEDAPAPRRSSLVLVPFLAALFAELAG